MTDFVPALAMSSLVLAIVNLLRYARAKDTNGVTTILFSWAAGVGGVMVAAQTQFANQIPVGADTLADMSAWSQVFIGVTVAAGAGVLNDLRKAIDNADTAVKPPLVPPKVPAVPLPDAPGAQPGHPVR